MFVKIKDLTFKLGKVYGIGKLIVPENRQTPEYYGISLWFEGAPEPIIVTYEQEEDRDHDLDVIYKALEVAKD